MSDRAPVTGFVCDMETPEQRRQVLDVLAKYELEDHDGGLIEEVAPEEVGSWISFIGEEMAVGADVEIADDLEAIGTISFSVAQDAKYEFDASVTMYVPRLGRVYRQGSNSNGPDEVFVAGCDLDEVVDWAMSSPLPKDLLVKEFVRRIECLSARDHRRHLARQKREAKREG
jgi:hypothetical protein